MSTDDLTTRATSFGQVAEHYDAFRPGPPVAAVKWLFPELVHTVVDLGAGTGSLSRLLTAVAEKVVAVDPDEQMLRLLAHIGCGIEALEGRGESIPLPPGSVDAIVASSSWHWVDPEAGVREAARVLRPGGLLAAMWSGPDPNGAFAAQAQAALSQSGGDEVLGGTLSGQFAPANQTLTVPEGSGFATVEHRRFDWVMPLDADQLIGLLGTLSWVIVMDEPARVAVFEKARRLLNDVLGVKGDITIDVDFACETYATRRIR